MLEIEEKKRTTKQLQTHVSTEDYEKWQELADKSPHGSVFSLLKFVSGQYLRGELISGEELKLLKAELENLKLQNLQLQAELNRTQESLQVEIGNRTTIYNKGLEDGQKLTGVLKAKANQYDEIYKQIADRADGCGVFGTCLCKSKEIHSANQMIRGLQEYQTDIMSVIKGRI